MDEIKDIVRMVIGQMAPSSPGQRQLGLLWEKILSKTEKEHSKIGGLKDGCLLVSVDSPAWLYHFNLKKKKMLDEIQKEFSEIKKIYFKIGKL